MPEKTGARNTLAALAHESGYFFARLADLDGLKAMRGSSTKIYRHPENSNVTCSGRGRKPGWFSAQVVAGKDPKELVG